MDDAPPAERGLATLAAFRAGRGVTRWVARFLALDSADDDESDAAGGWYFVEKVDARSNRLFLHELRCGLHPRVRRYKSEEEEEELWERLFDVYLDRQPHFSRLKARARELGRMTPDECAFHDRECVWFTDEWVLDVMLLAITVELKANKADRWLRSVGWIDADDGTLRASESDDETLQSSESDQETLADAPDMAGMRTEGRSVLAEESES